MEKFNLTKAKQGSPVITRDQRKVKILLFNRSSNNFPIVAIIENKHVACFTENGTFYLYKQSKNDLFME